MEMSAEIFILMLSTVMTVSAICPPQNQSADLRFTRELGANDRVRIGHTVAVLCCAEGYDKITWSQKKGNLWKPFPPPPVGDDNAPVLQENRQVLRFYSAKFSDQATYRCIVTKEGRQSLEHLTELQVINCEERAGQPLITEPFPENQTIDKFGGNITFHCTGYFGCSTSKGRYAFWTLANGTLVNTVSDRYTVQQYKKDNETKQVAFTITSVKEVDLKHTFVCRLFTAQTSGRMVTRMVKIHKREKPDLQTTPWTKIGLTIGGSVVLILVIIISIIFLRCKYGPQIRLFLSSRVASLGPKQISNENYTYHVFIYHADADEEIALHMKKKLSEENYDVFVHADIEGNQNVLRMFSEKTSQSALVLFLYSEALRNDSVANFLLQSFINERKGKDILFLEVADYKPKEIMNWARHVKDEERVEDCKEVIDDVTIEMIKRQQNDVVDDLQFWKVLPRLKVPAEGSSEREQRYFWCSLQNKIPKFERKYSSLGNNALTRPENKMKINEKSDDVFALTYSSNGDELVTKKVAGIDSVSTSEAVKDITKPSSPDVEKGLKQETENSGVSFTVPVATNYVYCKEEEQSPLCRGELGLQGNISFQGAQDNAFEQSKTNQSNKHIETAKQRNNNLNLIIKMPSGESGPSSSSPESGYVTSPVEKTYGIEVFLPLIDETTSKASGAQDKLQINSED